MAASAPVPKTIYLGTFVHCISLSELEIGENGAIGVDENGIIQFVEKKVDLQQVHEKHADWKDASVVQLRGHGFFFPGFIGMFSRTARTNYVSPWPGKRPSLWSHDLAPI
jgi:guanine deaminase